MQVVIEILREAPFLAGGTIFRGADIDDPNPDMRSIKTEPFMGKVIGVRKEIAFFDANTQRFVWDEEYLPEEEFKKTVKKCAILGKNSRVIAAEDINVYDMNDDFFTDERLSVNLTAGKVVLDDDIPINKILIANFLANKDRFVKIDGDRVPTYSDQIYSIGFVDEVEKVRVETSAIELDVAASLSEMGRPKMLILCKLWDLNPGNRVSDKSIRAQLFDEIKRDPNNKKRASKAQFFKRFVLMNKVHLDMCDKFLDGRKSRLITRDNDDNFTFMGNILGRDEEESIEFLLSASNENMVKDLTNGIKLKRPKELRDMDLNRAAEIEAETNKPIVTRPEAKTDGKAEDVNE